MTTVKTTITSKNQVTIPAAIVRKLALRRSQQLQVRSRGNDIVLTPLPSLTTALQPVWVAAAESIKKPLSDHELKRAIREAAASNDR